jgi:hypothetical protein
MLVARDMLRVAHDIYGPAHDQPAIPDIEDGPPVYSRPKSECLLPRAFRLSVVDRKPAFEGRMALEFGP